MQLSKCLIFVFLIALTIKSVGQSPTLVLQKGHFKKINSINVSKSGREMITTGDDGTIKIWDVFSQKLLGELETNGNVYKDAYFSPNDKYIIAGSVHVYDSKTGACIYNNSKPKVYTARSGKKYAYISSDRQISPNGEFVLSTPLYDTITPLPPCIFSTLTGKMVMAITRDLGSDKLKSYDNQIFISDSTILIFVNNDTSNQKKMSRSYNLYDFKNKKLIASFADNSSSANTTEYLQVSPGGRYFFVNQPISEIGSSDAREPYAELWDIVQKKMIWHKPIQVKNFCFRNDDAELVIQYDTLQFEREYAEYKTGNEFRRLVRFGLPDGAALDELPVSSLRDMLPSFSARGNYFATAAISNDKSYSITIRDQSDILVSTCSLTKVPTAFAFSRDNRFLVSGYSNGNFAVWDIGNPVAKEIAAVDNNIDPVLSMHNDFGTNKMFYVTKNMYGEQAAQTSNKISFFSTGNQSINDIHYFLNDKYSVLDVEGEGGISKWIITDNSKPAATREFTYRVNSSRSVTVESLLANQGTKDIGNGVLQTRLDQDELEWINFYSKTVDEKTNKVGQWLAFAGPPIVFTFGVIKSRHALDTILLYSTLDGFTFNKKLNGYIYRGLGNFLIPRSNLIVTPLTTDIRLMWSILSEDANFTIGFKPDDGAKFRVAIVKDDPKINSFDYLYCLDIKNKFKFGTPIKFKGDQVGELKHLIFSPDGKTACILSAAVYPGASFIRVVDAINGKPLYNLRLSNSNTVLGAQYTKDSRYVYSWTEGGICTKWDLKNETPVQNTRLILSVSVLTSTVPVLRFWISVIV
jgi:WD40 repeat protein